MSVVVIGESSFLARAVRKQPAAAGWKFLSYREADKPEHYKDATCVVNFALHGDVRKGIVNEQSDLDSRVAKILLDTPANYVMISTRAVYGPSIHEDGRLVETDPLSPASPYGMGKKQVEDNLRAILPPERLAILRLSNIFGDEGLQNRSTFFAMALDKLATTGRINYDMNPAVKRDFFPASACAQALTQIVERFRGGTYNLGSGLGIETGKIAAWLIEGFGSGALHSSSDAVKDAFWLDMTQSRESFNLPALSVDDIRQECLRIGRELRAVAPAAGQSDLKQA
jgi:nucleoside-diphosphate-sugar epimerase